MRLRLFPLWVYCFLYFTAGFTVALAVTDYLPLLVLAAKTLVLKAVTP